MASGKGLYLDNAVVNWVAGNTAMPAVPATLYVALSTNAAGTNMAAALSGEVTGGAYARASIPNSNTATNTPGFQTTGAAAAANASTANPATRQNSATVTFPTATASWGTVNQYAIMDAASGGNVLYWGDLTTAKTVSNGDVATLAAAALTLNET